MTPPTTQVHAICKRCYALKPNVREPITLDFPHCAGECCCYCGVGTYLGIYYRDVPLPSKYCRCDESTVHPYYGTRGSQKSREYRTASYYHDDGKPTFDIKRMTDGDVDDYLDGEDDE